VYRDERVLHMVMEFIPGQTLQHIWAKLKVENKLSIANVLHEIFNLVRALPSLGYFGSISRGPYIHRFFQTLEPGLSINGPFESSANVGLALAKRSQQNWKLLSGRGFTSQWFAKHLPTAFSNRQSVFTHAGVHPQNNPCA
jgi:hypothetical protein